MTGVEPFFPAEVGRCIYCRGDAATPMEELSKEHIIAFSFNGEWILRNASCKYHRDITSAFEGLVFDEGLGALREKMGFRTRHKERRTGTLPVSFDVEDQRRTETVSYEDHPGAWCLPLYAPPTKIVGGEPANEVRVVDWVGRWHTPAAQRLKERFGATALHIPYVDPVAWAQTLAKIGYAFAVGCCGLDTFEEVHVLPTILERGKRAGHFVGCLNDDQRNTGVESHQITLVQGGRELVAYILLFAEMGFPEYTVAVGRLRDTEYRVMAASIKG